MDPEPARARLVHEAQPAGRGAQCFHDLRQCLQVPRDLAVVPNLAVPPFLGERDVDRFLVDIHPHEHVTFLHDLPPLACGAARRLLGTA